MKHIYKYLLVLTLIIPFSCHAKVIKRRQMVVVTMENCHEVKSPKKPFILVLKRGEPYIESLVSCIERMDIESASVSGFGAIENPVVAAYNLKKQQYASKKFMGIYQLASLNGTISTNPKHEKVAHVHVVFCDTSYRAYGGHLMLGDCGITAEITIIPFPREMYREYDEDIGLDLIVPEK